ncbi:DEAD-box ATP-dependent RNA helicase 36 [Apostasia shenzhenica]|uniref:DEAD-box ATP-dependent RNA helicase 36 n=1 Tax=Apostasia shenzhenica TaxID=1088818 RepID=A0A2I0A1D3_9ASPA|nr:DEAD-box ATP-dependent RNA helicase 36 [Apostasia shenzhenica]
MEETAAEGQPFRLFSSRPKRPPQTLASISNPLLPTPKTSHTDHGDPDANSAGAASFLDLGLSQWAVDTCRELGMRRPTAVQRHCIPRILAGDDVLGIAQTGSGKTAAFALPILNRLAEVPYGVFALVLTPTRELACQLAEQFRALGSSLHVRCTLIVGGMDMIRQARALVQRPHIVVATPGRIKALLSEDPDIAAVVSKTKFLVLDEADRVLDVGFEEELRVIFKCLPKSRQTLLFSATMTNELQALLEISANRSCHLLSLLLEELDQPAVALHSLKSQSLRLSALSKFKSGRVPVLLATDVASRGLDIPTVDLVINYDIPRYPRDYVHRVGRTARAGRGGLAVSFITEAGITRDCSWDAVGFMLSLGFASSLSSFQGPLCRDQEALVMGLIVGGRRLQCAIPIGTGPADFIRPVQPFVFLSWDASWDENWPFWLYDAYPQNDVELIHQIEGEIGKMLDAFECKEKEVLEDITKVYKARRVARMKMIDDGFEEKVEKRKAQKMKALEEKGLLKKRKQKS